jgi:chromosome segregation ATPase
MDDRLRRGVFGYSRKSVQEVLNGRDLTIVESSREAREAEEKLTDASAQLEKGRMDLHSLQTRNRELEAQLQAAGERIGALELSETPSSSEGLTEVLHATERALARLTGNARREAERELERTEEARDNLRSEVDRLAAWREHVSRLAEAIPGSIEDVRHESSSAPGRLRDALAPITEAVETLAARLSELAGSAPPPTTAERSEEEVISLLEHGGDGDGMPQAPPSDAPSGQRHETMP